jgi:hypothetical protein
MKLHTQSRPTAKAGTFRVPPEPTEAEIRNVARQLWLEAGCPVGRDLEHWLAAKDRLHHKPRWAAADALGRAQAPLHFPPGGSMVHATAAVGTANN